MEINWVFEVWRNILKYGWFGKGLVGLGFSGLGYLRKG